MKIKADTYLDSGKCRSPLLHLHIWEFPVQVFCSWHWDNLEQVGQFRSRLDQRNLEWTLRTRNPLQTKPNLAIRPLSFHECIWRWFDLERQPSGQKCEAQ